MKTYGTRVDQLLHALKSGPKTSEELMDVLKISKANLSNVIGRASGQIVRSYFMEERGRIAKYQLASEVAQPWKIESSMDSVGVGAVAVLRHGDLCVSCTINNIEIRRLT